MFDDLIGFFGCLLVGFPCGLALIHSACDALLMRRGEWLFRSIIILFCAPSGAILAYGSLAYCHHYLFH